LLPGVWAVGRVSGLNERGRFLARVQGPVSGNVLLRRQQYRCADDLQVSAELARAMVIGKIANCRTVLLRATRDRPEHPSTEELSVASLKLARLLERLKERLELEQVRGIEGDAGRIYFSVFDHLVTAQKEEFQFLARSRRPPLDNLNALLSFIYTLLVHDTVSALEAVGLDPAVGFLHRDRPGRPGLALDLMEEFRPLLADRLVLTLVNLQQVRGKGFEKSESGGVLMDDATRKEVLVSYQKRKQDEIQHPFFDEKMAVGLLPHARRSPRGSVD